MVHLPCLTSVTEISALWMHLRLPHSSRTSSFHPRKEHAASIPARTRPFLQINWTTCSRWWPSSPPINPHSCHFILLHHPTASPSSVLTLKQPFTQALLPPRNKPLAYLPSHRHPRCPPRRLPLPPTATPPPAMVATTTRSSSCLPSCRTYPAPSAGTWRRSPSPSAPPMPRAPTSAFAWPPTSTAGSPAALRRAPMEPPRPRAPGRPPSAARRSSPTTWATMKRLRRPPRRSLERPRPSPRLRSRRRRMRRETRARRSLPRRRMRVMWTRTSLLLSMSRLLPTMARLESILDCTRSLDLQG